MQKYGMMANSGVDHAAFKCAVCDGSHGFNWSDLHGEGMCNNCGTPYDLKTSPPTLHLRPEWVPVCRQYFAETKAYMGLGQILIWRDYPECKRGRLAFHEWLDAHPEIVPKNSDEAEQTAA